MYWLVSSAKIVIDAGVLGHLSGSILVKPQKVIVL